MLARIRTHNSTQLGPAGVRGNIKKERKKRAKARHVLAHAAIEMGEKEKKKR